MPAEPALRGPRGIGFSGFFPSNCFLRRSSSEASRSSLQYAQFGSAQYGDPTGESCFSKFSATTHTQRRNKGGSIVLGIVKSPGLNSGLAKGQLQR
jgi:hypothetical protein